MDNSIKDTDEPEAKKAKQMEEPEEASTDMVSDSSPEPVSFPPDTNISSMLEDIDFKDGFLSVTDRYFTLYYKVDMTKPRDDICIWIHSNKICMISLAPSHNVFSSDQITSVNFKVSDKVDRSTNKVSGKGKHGAQPLQENSNLCSITTSDNQTHMIKCGMIGKLVEVNQSLLEEPELLRNPPHKSGYLAIILLNIKLMDKMKKSLLTRSQYEEVLREREDSLQKNDS